MTEQKVFTGSLYGYSKNQVKKYIDDLTVEFENKLYEKDNVIIELNNRLRDLEAKYEAFKKETGNLNTEKQKIANAILKAEEKAEEIIKNVHNRAEEEKRNLESTIEKERERLVDMRKNVKDLKNQVVTMLKNFESTISNIERKFDES